MKKGIFNSSLLHVS